MVRWLVAVLIIANLLMFAVARGSFGPLPSAGGREPHHLLQQVRPESLSARPVRSEESGDQAVVGAPAPSAPVQATPLNK